MRLQNLIEKINQAEANTTITPIEITRLLQLKDWEPTENITKLNKIKSELNKLKLEKAKLEKKEIKSTDIDKEAIEHIIQNEKHLTAKKAVLDTLKNSNLNLTEFIEDFLWDYNSANIPESILNRYTNYTKIYTFFPKNRLKTAWTKLYNLYQKAYKEAALKIDTEQAFNKIISEKIGEEKRIKEYDLSANKNKIENLEQQAKKLKKILKTYQNNNYIKQNSIKEELLIPKIIESEIAEGELWNYNDNKFIKFKPISIITLEEIIINPQKYINDYIFVKVILGPNENNKLKDEKIYNNLNNNNNDNNNSIDLNTSGNINSHNEWISTEPEKTEFIITSSTQDTMTICSFPTKYDLCAYILQNDDSKNILTSNASNKYLALTLQNLKKNQKKVVLGGTINSGGIFTADTILSAYAGMSHNIGYLDKY